MKSVKLIDPVSYNEMLKLVANSKIILTDSGGLQKEAFWLHAPCITLRGNTEWIETVQSGANVLVGNDTKKIVQKAKEYLVKKSMKTELREMFNPFGNGQASKKILNAALNN